jgi:hypothetical protein
MTTPALVFGRDTPASVAALLCPDCKTTKGHAHSFHYIDKGTSAMRRAPCTHPCPSCGGTRDSRKAPR